MRNEKTMLETILNMSQKIAYLKTMIKEKDNIIKEKDFTINAYKVGKNIRNKATNTTNIEKRLDTITEETHNVISPDRTELYLPNNPGTMLTRVRFKQRKGRRIDDAASKVRIPLNNGNYYATSVNKRKELVILTDDDPVYGNSLKKENVKTTMFATLFHDEDFIGMLKVDYFKDSKKPRLFSDEQQLYLTTIASDICRTIKNGHKYHKDGLTELPLRKPFLDQLYSTLQQSRRVSVGMADIDHFKSYNDKYGHLVGDDVIKKVAEKMQEYCNNKHIFPYRYGGEEFSFLLLDIDPKKARQHMENIRKKIKSLIFEPKPGIREKLTISAGVVTHPDSVNATSPESLIGLADKALYEAKNSGRNRVYYWSGGSAHCFKQNI